MQIHLAPEFADTPDGRAAEAIIRQCVHCGFCNATCPTYQVFGDELDGPRGRIYQIKTVLEGAEPTRVTQQHLDRCLTCLNCETTCPAGVRYGSLLSIGRRLVDERVERPLGERVRRHVLREGLTSPLFAPAVRIGRALAALLPAPLVRRLRGAPRVPGARAAAAHDGNPATSRRVLVLAGCVQPALRPGIGEATRRVLAAAGIGVVPVARTGCCGALRGHLGAEARAHDDMRRNIDAWWPAIEEGVVEAILADASACALALKDYGTALAGDPAYAARARRVSELARDLSELLPGLVAPLGSRIRRTGLPRLVVHTPCTLQHGQGLKDGIAPHLAALGFVLAGSPAEAHLCCGSAGAYSVLEPGTAGTLLRRKLAALEATDPEVVVSANIGCIVHLQSGTPRPVRHWIEVLAEALDPA